MKYKKFRIFSHKTTTTKNLTKKQIMQICKLKNQHWKFGIKSQFDWFVKNSHPEDIHYQVLFKNNLIGYLHLGLRNLEYLNKTSVQYVLFRNLIVSKNFRSYGIGFNIMKFANNFIEKKNKIGFLICKKKLIKFYSNYNWKLYKKVNFKLLDHSHNYMKFMFYNFKYLKKFKIKYKY